ncbi:MAG: hypothetical protein EXS14_03895 [Planctomycetes bacterium]|nr:hypothetical protein [Planctomycetota bacterium]
MRGTFMLLATLLLSLPLLAQAEPAKPETKPADAKPAESKPADSAKTAVAADAKSTAKWVAIKGATIHTVSGPVLLDATILLKDTKIADVGRDISIPADAEVIDGRGKHVCPGFVAIAAKGPLGLRNSSGKEKAEHRFDPYADFMVLALANGITSAHESGGMADFGGLFGFSGSAFTGSHTGVVGGTVGKLTHGTVEGFALREPAALYLNSPVQGGGGAIAEQRDLFERAKKHRAARKAWLKELAGGKKDAAEPKTDDVCVALADAMDGDLPVFYYADNRRHIEHALGLAAEFDVPVVLHTAQEAWTVAAEVGRHARGVVLLPRGLGVRGTRPYTDLNVSAPHGWRIDTPAIMQRTGVPWAVLTLNTGISTTLLGGRDLMGLHLEAAFAVRGGATDAEALRAITLTPAEFLQVADRIGSLEPGKDADLLLMDREPLDYRAFVEKAWVNGRVAYDEDVTPLYGHIQTDRRQAPRKWKPWGIWGDLPDQKEAPPLPDGSQPPPVR